jgi:quercetin dioxygenase-like cupin family protein
MTKRTDAATATRIVRPDTPNEAMMFPSMAVYVWAHEPGETAGLHTHDVDHVLVMRSGVMRWTVDGEAIDAVAGDVIVAPAGVQHGFEVIGDEPVRLLCIESPNPDHGSADVEPDPREN